MKNTYQKLTALIIIWIVLILNISPVSSKNNELSDDEIDQKQTLITGKDYIYIKYWKAQSFKPTTQILTRIKLYMAKIGNISSDIEIFIKDSLKGPSLVNYSIPSTDITFKPSWIEFDFPNISTTPNNWYIIILKTKSGDQNNSYLWYQNNGDNYKRGEKYYSNNEGITWLQKLNIDFCFKTYGKNKQSELEISYIIGESRSCIKYGIKNVGKGIIKNLQVDISFKGGLILTSNKYTDFIDLSLYPNEVLELIKFPIIGIGRSEITITVNSPQISESTSVIAKALLLIFYIYIYPI